jgi:glyoxalase family protein
MVIYFEKDKNMQTIGLHHITAVAGEPQKNLDFYRQVLGQRLVKTTVNFDDPGTYHFYYGDHYGSPGTILTFFPWQHVSRGRKGNGETSALSYIISEESLSYWSARLNRLGIKPGRVEERFVSQVLPFEDPDGLRIELITRKDLPEVLPWPETDIPENHRLGGFDGVTLWLEEVEPTARILTAVLGYNFNGRQGSRYRYQSALHGPGRIVDIVHRPNSANAYFGAGSIHHIAFRATGDSDQQAFRTALNEIGSPTTRVMDRQYFRSIYFRTPGGVLFEIATDDPGFATDESLSSLGAALKLPPWLEAKREQIEEMLPPINRAPVQVQN